MFHRLCDSFPRDRTFASLVAKVFAAIGFALLTFDSPGLVARGKEFGLRESLEDDRVLRAHSLHQMPNTIVGRAIDENEKPVSRAELFLFRVNYADGSRRLVDQCISGDDGGFRFDNVIDIPREYPDGQILARYATTEEFFQLIIRASHRISESRTIETQKIARYGDAQVFKLPQAATLAGQIIDPDGNPVANAYVSVGTQMCERWEGALSDRTDAEGHYVIKDVAPFNMEKHLEFQETERRKVEEAQPDPSGIVTIYIPPRQLTIDHPNFAVTVSNVESIPGTTDVRLGPPAILEGRVLYSDSGEPVAGARVTVTTSGDRGQAVSIYGNTICTDHAGKYRFGNLPPGKYDVWAECTGWVNLGVRGVAAEPNSITSAPDLQLTKGGLIKIRILDSKSGEPMQFQRDAQLVVEVQPTGLWNRFFGLQALSANADGKFEVRAFPGGNHVGLFSFQMADVELQPVSVEFGDMNPDVTVAEGETVELSLVANVSEFDALLPPDRETAALLDHAVNLMYEHSYQAVIDLVSPIIKDHPALAHPRLLRAEAYEALGQVYQAKDQYNQLLQDDLPNPFDYKAHNNLAFLLSTVTDEQLRDGPRSVQLAEEAHKLSHGVVPEVYDTLAAAYAEVGKMEEAVKTMQRAIQLFPDNKTFHAHLDLYLSNHALRVNRPALTSEVRP